MNHLSNHFVAQATHREYEEKYGHRYSGEVSSQDFTGSVNQFKLFLALSGSVAVAVFAAVLFLF